MLYNKIINNNMKNSSTNILVIILIIVVVVGFYWTINEIREAQTINNTDQEISESLPDSVSPGQKATSSESSDSQKIIQEGDMVVPTAILFEKQSSPLLSPQTMLTIVLDSVVKSEDGLITLNLKVYTNEANSYSAIQPSNLFELVNFQGENQKPLQVKGSFDSIAPKSAITGQVIFKEEPDTQEIILQVETQSSTNHYRFDFENESYEEAILG